MDLLLGEFQERAGVDSELINIDKALNEGNAFKIKVLELLKSIVSIYDNCSPKEKNQMLRAIFPEGFMINKERSKVLTEGVNVYLFLNPCQSDECNILEIKNETTFSNRPALGGRRDSNPRPSVPQTDALTN